MRNGSIAWAAVMGMGLAAGAATAATLDVPKASGDFAYKYEGDALPTAASYSSLGFVLNDPNGIEAQTVSLGNSAGVDYLRIDTDTTNGTADVVSYRIDGGAGTAWDPNFTGPFTLEFRGIVRPGNSGTFGAGFQMRDENSDGLFQFFYNKVVGPLSTVNTDPNNDTWHAFRIASYSPDDSSAGQVYVLWRDGQEIGTFANNAAFAGKVLEFGDFVSFLPDINMDVDYLRWDTTGAYQPIPEPSAAMALIAVGSAAVLRRRRTQSR